FIQLYSKEPALPLIDRATDTSRDIKTSICSRKTQNEEPHEVTFHQTPYHNCWSASPPVRLPDAGRIRPRTDPCRRRRRNLPAHGVDGQKHRHPRNPDCLCNKSRREL